MRKQIGQDDEIENSVRDPSFQETGIEDNNHKDDGKIVGQDYGIENYVEDPFFKGID